MVQAESISMAVEMTKGSRCAASSPVSAGGKGRRHRFSAAVFSPLLLSVQLLLT